MRERFIMSKQNTILYKSFVAYLALVRFLPRMPPHMHLNTSLLPELLPTNLTNIRFHPTMNQHVPFQRIRQSEALAAYFTFLRFFTRMLAQVIWKILHCIGIITDFALFLQFPFAILEPRLEAPIVAYVSFELIVLFVGHAAFSAFVWAFPGMDSHVTRHVCAAEKFFMANLQTVKEINKSLCDLGTEQMQNFEVINDLEILLLVMNS